MITSYRPVGAAPDVSCPERAYPRPPAAKRLPGGYPEQALWFGHPGRALRLLDGYRPDARTGWLRGVALLAQGRYEEADRVLRRVPGSLALSALASSARQRGRYGEATVLDTAALESAGDVEARSDALVGLTADAIGTGDRAAAHRWLARLYRLDGDWRGAVRCGWGATELSLLSDLPESAASAAYRAVRCARMVRAPRHLAKSLLFYGVSVREVARRQAVAPRIRSAAVILRRAERLAAAVEAFPVWGVACRLRQETLKEVAVTGEAVAQNTYTAIAS